jgi:ATP-dependent DNA ligase
MEALAADALPAGEGWQFEPKWDGFRCLAFRDGVQVELQSKAGQPLARYFPEIVERVLGLPATQFVLDGEIVVPVAGQLSFDDLLQRIHPAASRVARLSRERPAVLIVFDLLVDERGQSLLERPLSERRRRLEEFAREFLAGRAGFELSPATGDRGQAGEWFTTMGTALDGIMAKRTDMDYRSGERTAMRKIKRVRTADCVVAGFRYAASPADDSLGSLLLGLYDHDGLLHHVGFSSSLTAAERPAILARLQPLVGGSGFTGHAPGGPSRWSTERSGEWVALRPELVAEVRYDHFTGGRFRHGTKLLRWRPDKRPQDCTLDQVEGR